MMCDKRPNGLGAKKSYFIHYSENEGFYQKRGWCEISELEKELIRNGKKYSDRWKDLKKEGEL